jgi:CheY-like chemotaxis protein
MPRNIFLSYCREDNSVMTQVRDYLNRNQLTVWTDEGIKPGTASWKLAIEDAIKKADCVVVVLSPDAYNSKWVRAEMDFAEAQGKLIFPILARGTEKDSVPMGFNAAQRIDIRGKEDFQTELRYLVNAVNEHFKPEPPTSPLVLVVDDDPTIQKLVGAILEQNNYRVHFVSSGTAAMRYLEDEKVPDLVILDLVMRGMNGSQVCEWIRGRGDTVPIIVLSAHDDEERKVEALDAGADDYVTKPFKGEEFMARVRAAMRRTRTP